MQIPLRHQWDTRVEDDYAEKRGRGMLPLPTIEVPVYTAHGHTQLNPFALLAWGLNCVSDCSFAVNLKQRNLASMRSHLMGH